MECSECGRTHGFQKLEDGTFICPDCKSDSHVYDEEGRCWCEPQLIEFDDGDGSWIHNGMM